MEEVDRIFQGDTSCLQEIRSLAVDFGRAAGLSPSSLDDLELAVDEAVTNIIRHGYEEDPALPEDLRTIHLRLQPTPLGLAVIIRDHARPFDPTRQPLPNLDTHARSGRTSGLGVFAMRRYMDSVRYQYLPGYGNELYMEKYRPGNQEN